MNHIKQHQGEKTELSNRTGIISLIVMAFLIAVISVGLSIYSA